MYILYVLEKWYKKVEICKLIYMCDNNAKAYTEALEILKYVIKFHEKVWGEVN